MNPNAKGRDYKLIIKSTSPLYKYWDSNQSDSEEKKRIEISCLDNKNSNLFKNEPYKWEVLYQSILRQVYHQDYDSIKGLKILLSMLNEQEKVNTIQRLKKSYLLKKDAISILEDERINQSSTKTNRLRFIRILTAIFLNPFGIEIKRDCQHIYEYTGKISLTIMRWLKPS